MPLPLDAPVDKRDRPYSPPARAELSDEGRMRRRALMLVAALGMMATFPAWLQGSVAHAAAAASPQAAPAEFLALSQLVTGRSQLDTEVANRIYAALSQKDPAFPGQASALWQHANAGVDGLQAAALNDPALSKALSNIVSAWYLGEAGGQVVQYKTAIGNQVVEDVVVTPSYCRAAPGYWTAQPPHTVARSI
ncbi:sugar dehydrogenase complex small subunit [Silvimonas sp. JCM 19000]